MDSLPLAASTTSNVSILGSSNPKGRRNLQKQQRNFVVFAAKDHNKLGNWDQMERKFGKLIGENPKLTLSKIEDNKSNPEHNGKRTKEPLVKAPITTRHSMPNVILWNTITFKEDDVGAKMSLSLSLKPNLSLKMGKEEGKERFSDMILVKNDNVESTVNIKDSTCNTEKHISVLQKGESIVDQAYGDHNRSRSAIDGMDNSSLNLELTSEMGNTTAISLDSSQESGDVSNSRDGGHRIDFLTGSHPSEHMDIESDVKSSSNITAHSVTKLYQDATFQGPPKRLDQPMKERPYFGGRITRIQNLILNAGASENLPPILTFKDLEYMDWKSAEDLIKTTGRGEVELISCSPQGFVVSFGSLIGFLPYQNIATKWKFLAFETWLRRKGLDPATYRRKLGIIGSYDAKSKTVFHNPNVDTEKIKSEIVPHMKLEDLLAIYDQEKLEYLSNFVGQKMKVYVILANRDLRKLIFSVKPKEKEELIQRKRSIMAKLHVGDIVTCCIKKISYFGIFVEVEGVPALIHQTEVSWDATSNPTSSFKIGQVVEAKVHQLDFSLDRIFLSLKEIMPDPLTDSLEAILGDQKVSDDTLEANQSEIEWADLELLIKELQQYEGIELVTKGRFFMSPSLTLTFQVYMASMFKNQYKLLARDGYKVQEVVVQTSLDNEEIKHAILWCTNLDK